MGQTRTIGKTATSVTTEHCQTTVTYHYTPVVRFDADIIELRTNGWYTVTTKARMNQASSQYELGFSVFQRDFMWYVQTKAGTFPFVADHREPMRIYRATGKIMD